MNRHFIRFHNVCALRSTHPEVRRLKRQAPQHVAHGNKVWRSSFVLMDYLLAHPIPNGSAVMDLGCGWGLGGIFMAKQFDAQVTGVDIDPGVEPFLRLQAEINDCSIAFKRQSLTRISKSQLAPFHTLIGSDICFWESMADMLFKLIRRARQAGVEQVLITDPGRPPFWDLVERCRETWGADYFTHSIQSPIETTKHILVVRKDSEQG